LHNFACCLSLSKASVRELYQLESVVCLRMALQLLRRRMKYFVMKSVRSPLCLLKHVVEAKVEGRIEVTVRQGRRRKQFLDDFNGDRGYCNLKEEAPDRTAWLALDEVMDRHKRLQNEWIM